VVQLPVLNQISFGGLPNSRLLSWRSESFDTIVNRSFWRSPKLSCRQSRQAHNRERELTQEINLKPTLLVLETNSPLAGVSSWDEGEFSFAIGRKGQASSKVFFGQIRKISKNLRRCHAGRHVIQDFVNGDSQTANARLTASLSRLKRDYFLIIHKPRLIDRFPQSSRSQRKLA
jgi:hypothetical protein